MTKVAQFFEHLVAAFDKGRHSRDFTVARVGFIGEVRMRTRKVIVATEIGTRSPYPLRDLNRLLRSFGVILSRRHVHGTNRFYIYASPVDPAPESLSLAVPREPMMPPVVERECLACGGTGAMEASWSVVPGPEALPCHECFVCEGERSVWVCSGCNEQIEAGQACSCLQVRWGVAA